MGLRASCRSLYVAVVFAWALSQATHLAEPWGTLAWIGFAGMAPVVLYLAARVRAMVEEKDNERTTTAASPQPTANRR